MSDERRAWLVHLGNCQGCQSYFKQGIYAPSGCEEEEEIFRAMTFDEQMWALDCCAV